MKLVLRILNLVLAAVSLTATVLLFALPAFSFNSKVVVDVKTLTDFVPKTAYTSEINATDLLGTDEIQAGVKFSLSIGEINKVMNGDRDIINERVIVKNLDDTLKTLDDAVDVIADNTIRQTLKSTIKDEVKKQIDSAKPADSDKTADQIMDLVDLDEAYFKSFSTALYNEANKSTASISSVNAVLQEQIDDALMKAEKAGAIKPGTYTEEQKAGVKANFTNILNSLEMVNPDETIKPLSDLPYLYVIKFAKEKLNGKVPEADLAQKAEETNRQYSDRLLEKFVINSIPDMVYSIIGYVCLGLFIGMFVFAGIWLAFAAFEILHFFFPDKKHRLFNALFLPAFMLTGLLQLALGFVLTGVCKFILPEKLDLAALKLPIKSGVIIPRTYTLGTSICFIVAVGIGLVYLILKLFVPKNKEPKELKKVEEVAEAK